MRSISRSNRRGFVCLAAALVAAAWLSAPLTAQNTITGSVVDENTQRPLIGAQILIEGSDLGALTDNRGRFLILNAPSGTVTVRVVMIGYREGTATATGATPVTIEMVESAISLDEIIVTGTVGEQQARSIGNAIGRIDAAGQQELAPVADVQAMLSATIPGVRIQNSGGAIGEGGIARIRGAASLTLAATPIVVVDGVRVNGDDGDSGLLGGVGSDGRRSGSRINDFDPDDIESIEVIKGPAAATLYGTEASNGVIQIITKRGARGAPRVNATVRQGGSWLPNPQELVPPTYYKSTTGEIVEVNVLKNDKEDTYGLLGGGRDWFRTGHNQSYGADISGGTEAVTYFVSGEFDRQEGPVTYNWQNTVRGRANFTYVASDDLKFDFSLGANRSTLESASAQQPLLTAIIWSCPAPGCEPGLGSPQALDGASRGYIAYLPEAYEDEIEGLVDIDRTTFSLQTRWEPTDWMAHRLTFGGDFGNRTNSELFLATGNLGNSSNQGRKTVANERTSFITADYQVSSSYAPTDNLTFTTGGGLQYYQRQSEVLFGSGETFPVSSLETIPSGATRTADEDFRENKTFGVFVQEQISWQDKLFLTGAVRGDDNSAFGENFDFVVYPKLSGSYVISDEDWFSEGVGFVQSLKLRAAWGKAGRQPDVFDALRTYQPSVGPGGQSTISPENIGNPDLKPEVGSEFEIGFDGSVFADRVGFEFTYFDQTTADAIVSVPALPSNGFPGVQFRNIGEVKNSGIEIGLNANIFRGDNVSVDLGGSFSTTTNEITDLGGQPAIVNAVSQGQYHVEGQSLASIYQKRVVSGTVTDGVVSNVMCEGGDVLPNTPNLSLGGGAPIACDLAPNVLWGQPIPDKEGAAYATVSIGGLQLYAMADYVGGRTIVQGDIAAQHRFFINSRAILERTDPILLGYESLGGVGLWQSGTIDGSYVKLRTVSASYTLPASWADRINASRVNINFSANNMATLWQGYDAETDGFGVKLMDPEVAQQSGTTRGLNAYNQEGWPQLRTFSTTFKITF